MESARSQRRTGFAVARDESEFRKPALEVYRGRRINRDGDHPDAGAGEEGGDEFQARGIDEQRPFAAAQSRLAGKMGGDLPRPLVKREVGIAVQFLPFFVEETVEALVRLDRRPMFQVVDDRAQAAPRLVRRQGKCRCWHQARPVSGFGRRGCPKTLRLLGKQFVHIFAL